MDSYKSKFHSPLFNSLWVAALGDQYPVDIQPYSSCTHELLAQLESRISINNQSNVLDLGCGTGGLSIWFAKMFGCECVGIDCSLSAIEIANNRAYISGVSGLLKFHVGKFENTGIYDKIFDIAISIDALPFATDADLALREINRCLKPNGQLIFTARELSPNTPLAIKLGPAWKNALACNGFRLVDVHKRIGISELWKSVYDKWLENQDTLRDQLPNAVVNELLEEAKTVGKKLNDERDWLLILAKKSGEK